MRATIMVGKRGEDREWPIVALEATSQKFVGWVGKWCKYIDAKIDIIYFLKIERLATYIFHNR